MGNGSSKPVAEHHGQLKVKQYPCNIKEEDWIPTEWTFESIQSECLLKKGKDRRIPAMPNDYKHCDDEKKSYDDDNKENIDTYHHHQIYNIGRLKMQRMINNEVKHLVGTACIIHHTVNKSYILTSAHNVGGDNGDNTICYNQSMWFETNKNTLDKNKKIGYKNIKTYDCTHYYVHPKYIQYIQDERKTDKGFDIAIVEVMDITNSLKQREPFKLRFIGSKLDFSNIKVIGFPGEEKLRGAVYGMKGSPIFQPQRENQIKYKDIDTTPGQSGSPIFKASNSDNIYESFMEIVGVHAMGNSVAGYNEGVLLNDSILNWIHDQIDGDCIHNYDCNALLITSSKTKYADCLNKIYTKYKRTEAFKTRRIYYDGDTVKKADILYFIKKAFEQPPAWKSVVLYFCGESDDDGNWIINENKKDVITLTDIAMCNCWNNAVFIVSDCEHSGKWVQKYRENKNEFNNITAIQASSKNGEICEPGVFTAKYVDCCLYYSPTITNTIKDIGAGLVHIFSGITVGTIYDGAIKQTVHRTTATHDAGAYFQCFDAAMSHDEQYKVHFPVYNSWYSMDFHLTTIRAQFVGSAGSSGFY